MTISQSRFGSQAEVGRSPNRKNAKDQHHWGAAVGLGVAGTGYGATRAASVLSNSAGASKAKANQSRAGIRISQGDANLARNLQAVEQAKLAKLRGRNKGQAMWIVDGQGRRVNVPATADSAFMHGVINDVVRESNKHAQTASRHDLATKKSRDEARAHAQNYARMNRYSKLASRGGKIAIGTGLLGAAGALAQTEHARGTVGYKRPTRAQLRGRNVR